MWVVGTPGGWGNTVWSEPLPRSPTGTSLCGAAGGGRKVLVSCGREFSGPGWLVFFHVSYTVPPCGEGTAFAISRINSFKLGPPEDPNFLPDTAPSMLK